MHDYFQYIDVIRRPDGSLRPWEEHDQLARMEEYLDGGGYQVYDHPHNYKLLNVLVEYEKRSAIQTGIQKKCI